MVREARPWKTVLQGRGEVERVISEEFIGSSSGFVLVVSYSPTELPPCSGILAKLWFLFDAVPHLLVFTNYHLTTAISKSNPQLVSRGKMGELQRIASESHLLVQKWKPGSRREDSRRSLLPMSFFSCLNIEKNVWGCRMQDREGAQGLRRLENCST